MRINVYKNYTGKEFNSYEFDAKDGKTVGELFSEIDYENSLVFCNGNEINERYVPKDGDIVTIRTMPSSVSSLIVAGVVLAAFGIAEGISYGVTGKGLFKNLAEYLMPDVPTPKNNEQSQTETLPSLKGAKNQRAFGKPIPLVIGQSRLTPYLVGSYHTITGNDGENQRFHALYVLGYNDISAGAFKIGEQDLAANGMTEKYSSGNYSLEIGESNKKKGSITDFNELTPFRSANPVLEISNSGELNAYRQKVTEESIGRQIINADGTPLVFERASDQHPRTIQVEILFNSLFAYDSSGGMVDAEAKIGIAISYNGGSTYESFNPIQGNNGYENVAFDRGTICVSTIRRAKNKTLRFIAQRVIAPDRAWEIERANGYAWVIVQRMDKDSTDSKTSNKAYLSYIRTYVYDKTASFDELGNLRHPDYLVPQVPIIPKLRDKTTRVAFEIDATDNVSGTLDELNCMVVANCRTFSGGKWSDVKSPTSNPAANALNLMQSVCLGSNTYGDDKIDLYAFGEMYEFCESNGFSVGGVLTSQKKLSDVIDLILRNARSYRIVSGRKYSVFVDKPASVPVCVLNNSNLLAGEISNTKNFDTLPDGFKISFVNKNLGYDEDEVYVMFDDGKSPDDPNTVIESVDMPFVIDPRQIAKNAWFEYAKRKLRPETWTRTVSTEANLIEIGSLVELQDDTIQVGIGNGGYIRSLIVENGLIKGFVSTDKVNIYDVAKEYGVKITHSSETDNVSISVRKLAVSEPFYSDTFYFDIPIAESAPNAPAIEDLVSFGEYGKETISCLCINKKDKGDGKFALELLPYDQRVYDADKNANLEFDSKVSTVQKNVVQSTNDYVTREQLMEIENAIVNGIDKDSEPPDTPIVEQCKAYRDYVSVAFGELPAGTRNDLKAVEWQVNKEAAWEDFPAGLSFGATYEFMREVDGYPEAEDLNWRFRCRVTNVAGKKSEWSEPRTVDVSGYGTWRVSSARDGRARSYNEQGLYLAFDSQRPNTRVYYGNTLFRVTVKYDGNALEIVNNVPLNFYYYFDRKTDGYPERHENAAEEIRDLSLYSFEIRPVESFTGEQGEILEVAHIDVSGYGTWLIPEIAASAVAGEHSVSLAWTLDGETPYGAVKYDVLLDGSPIAENISRAHQAYRFAENLTKEEVGALKFSVRARNEAHGRTAEFAVDASGYLGYKIEKPEIAAKASKDGIEVSWRKTNDFYGKREYVLLKDGGEIFRSESGTSFFLKFGEGEFPEKSDIERIVLKARIDGDEDSATSDAAEIDTEGYLTYVPSTPTVYPSASGRNANLSWNAQDGVYGFLGCEIQIAKAYKTAGGKLAPITDEAELEWFAPALGLNPYESLENYKKGEAGGRLEVRGTAVSFSLPLFGQDADGAEDTPYAFRLRGKSEAGKVSEWTSPLFVLCRAVSAHDVVKAWDLDDNGEKVRLNGALGAKQIFVEELAAISANLGYITDGALRGNAYNYWAVSDTPMDDGSLLRRGSFRVGGKDQYILVEPRLGDSGEPTGEYDITFVVGNYSVSASGTQIRGGAFEVYDGSGNLMFSVSPDGISARVQEGTFVSKGSQFLVGPNVTRMPYELCVRTDAGVYSLACGIKDNAESMADYYVDVYKVEDGGSPERKFVGRIAGDPGSDDPAEYFAGYIAFYIVYSLSVICRGWATADGGTVVFPFCCPRKADDEIDEADVMYGEWTIDLSAARISFEHKYDSLDLSFDENAIYGSYLDGNMLFVIQNDEYYSNLGKYLKSVGLQFRKGNTVVSLAPSVRLNNSGRVVGFTMDGDTAYAAFGIGLITVVVRYDTRTGAAEAFLFYGLVPKNLETAEDSLPSALTVDGEFITLTGSFDLTESTDTSGGSLVHRVFNNCAIRIRRDGIAWTGIDLGALGDDPDAWSSALANCEPISGIRVYVSDYDDVAGDGNNVIRYLSNFARYGMLCMCRLSISDDIISLWLLRAELEDGDEDARGLFTVAGRVRTEVAKEFEFHMSDENGVDYLTDGMITAISRDGVFPGKFFGVDCALAQTFVKAGEVDYASYLGIYALEDGGDASGESMRKVGAGFVRAFRDRISGKTRYYLDTGAYIEFNEDGTLSAQTGPQGTPGRDGKDGRDGVDGKDGADGAPGRDGKDGVDGKDGTLDIGIAADADVAEDNYAVGTDGDGEVIRTPWSKVWAWIKSKIESVAHSPIVSTLRYSVGGRTGEILNATGDVSSGVKLVIGAGGPTIIGGGESAAAIAAGITTDTEVLHLTSDETVKIQTNIQNGVANAKTTTFNKDGSASFPGFIDITNAENSNSATPIKAIGGKVAANDYWRIAAGGTSNNGFVEIATADDGTEPIYVRQYSGVFATLVRTLTLLDGSGNTSLPGNLNISSGKQIVLPANSGIWIYGRNNAKIRQSTAAALWAPIMSIKTKNGSYEIGCCSENDNLYVRYATDANFNAGNNNTAEVCTINGDTSANFGGVLSSSKGIKIPTSQPSNLQDGMIWIT